MTTVEGSPESENASPEAAEQPMSETAVEEPMSETVAQDPASETAGEEPAQPATALSSPPGWLRVVSLLPAASSFVFDLGAGSTLIAVVGGERHTLGGACAGGRAERARRRGAHRILRARHAALLGARLRRRRAPVARRVRAVVAVKGKRLETGNVPKIRVWALCKAPWRRPGGVRSPRAEQKERDGAHD